MPIRSTNHIFHSLKQEANLKEVWIALSEDYQRQNMDKDRPQNNGTDPYPVHVGVNKINTFTLQHIKILVYGMLAMISPTFPPTNQTNAPRK